MVLLLYFCPKDAICCTNIPQRWYQFQDAAVGFIDSDIGIVRLCGNSVAGHVHRGTSKVGVGVFMIVLFVVVVFALVTLESLSDLYRTD